MAQLICKNVSLGYDGETILEHLHFQVEQGDYLCIIGENGAGKTTLMKAILGLKKPISGEISWGDGVRPKEIGYLTQQSEVQRDFPASVMEVILSGFQNKCGLRPFYNKTEKNCANEIMKKLGVDAFAKKCYRELWRATTKGVAVSCPLCHTKNLVP